MKIRLGNWLCGLLVAATATGSADAAEPYVPSDDGEVLVQLPASLRGQQTRIDGLKAQRDAAPTDVTVATELASHYLDVARRDRNLRYYGYAESAIQPWLSRADVPLATLVVRADIHQYFHRFDAAKADYLQVVRANPAYSKAWFSLAMISAAQADHETALAHCQALMRLNVHSWKLCRGAVSGGTSGIAQGQALLRSALDEIPSSAVDERIWALTALADIAVRLERIDEADIYFKEALALRKDSADVLLPYADFLLEQGRAQDALAVLANDGDTLNGAVRRCLALQVTSPGDIDACRLALKARFADSALRGDPPYFNEEVRANLYLFDDAARALALAKENWQMVKTPADAQLLLRAGLAANDVDAVTAVRQWLAPVAAANPALVRQLAVGPEASSHGAAP
ncbi:tetratricopeptide repeat protein [Tahibacter amnicola]|uniref:Tetratricopeptide repeat protein n=1 Tax=Tahibacter amnicola TaxID=2976241 RepID=A0ABY6BIR3_9GAMM|nr:hypothetical protein [Tahibacter amnicola]UXI69481.1 hypothetical protein N4264_07475 [Tahibacter amnicola]